MATNTGTQTTETTGKTYCYARVSTTDQDTRVQKDILSTAYPEAVVMEEKASATSRDNRPNLELLLTLISEGDRLVVWKLDRLARNMRDLTQIVHELELKGASLVIHDQHIDTGTASGIAFLQMLGVFAEFETNLRKERQAAGIAKAKEEGKYKGRKPTAKMQADTVRELKANGMGASAIAKKLGIGRASVYRILEEATA
ncbi:recombinase family protein [Parendozoicomonas haliclonae]|uniref:DNA-invertase hin n=1 Tax=Parendozoicomonas haliclonae TaxID=1960125 RepID=A0A1X7AHM0_9GAMM|nr:recombinase family protein [Parendozoicomonas haliclonae]SMA41444.1 DNA-invertase hin [Parendozoicomonas haliclonae]